MPKLRDQLMMSDEPELFYSCEWVVLVQLKGAAVKPTCLHF
jgi:hypothetical protein